VGCPSPDGQGGGGGGRVKILFVHQNYPGQFLHLAPALIARGHGVMALTAQGNPRPIRHPHAVYRHEEPAADHFSAARYGATYARMTARGAAVAETAAALRRRGVMPDVVFGHPGWGETLFLRNIWPEARHLCYAEFCYRATGLDAGFDPEFQSDRLESRLRVTARATHLIQAVATADAALAPTLFQRGTFPEALHPRIRVIHDGIDTDRLRPDPAARFDLPGGGGLRAGDEVLTFVNRNLEPYRGFHIFLRALPEVLAARPQAQVVLVGGEGTSYGPAPPGGGGWRDRLWPEVAGRIDPARVHFVGRLSYGDYLRLMQVSRVHAYLTYPFVLSWSLIEAMAIGPTIVASRTAPVEEVITDGLHGRLVDFFDVAGWAAALIRALADPRADAGLRAAARARAQADYDLRRVSLPALVEFVESAVR
jgi:glycosyltransferase involved in cell wall biosynthesis